MTVKSKHSHVARALADAHVAPWREEAPRSVRVSLLDMSSPATRRAPGAKGKSGSGGKGKRAGAGGPRSPQRSVARSPVRNSGKGARGKLEMEGMAETRSPGGTRTFEVVMNAGGKSPEMTDEEKLKAWKESLAAEEANGGDEDAFGFEDDGDYDDAAARAMRAKYGVPDPAAADGVEVTEPAMPRTDGTGPQPGQKFSGDFDFGGPGFQQVSQLTEENAGLLSQLDAKNAEIDRLEDLLAAVEPVPGMEPERYLDVMQGTEVVDQDPRDTKIIALAKTKRTLNVQLQKEQARVRALEAEVGRLQEIADGHVYPKKMKSKEKAEAKEAAADAAEMAEKVKAAESRSRQMSQQVMQMRIKLDQQTKELKATQAALQREVGSKVDIAKVIEEGSDWRGRAQKIVMMKAKIRDLQEKLREHGLEDRGFGATGASRGSGATSVDAQAKADLRAMETERARAIEELTEGFASAQREAAEHKRKAEAARARVRTLEMEQKKVKAHLKTMLAKATTDDEFVDALRQEVAQLRRQNSSLTGELNSTRSELERTVSTGLASLDGADDPAFLRSQSEDRQRRLDAQEKIISSLKGELRMARAEASGSGIGGAGGPGRPPRHARPSSGERARAAAKKEAEFADANLKMLQMDNMKLTEARDLLRGQLREADAREEELVTEVSNLQAKCAQYERDLGVQRSGVGAKSAHRTTPKAAEEMKAQLEALTEENAALRRTYRKAIEKRDSEVAAMRSQLEEQQRLYSQQIERFRKQATDQRSEPGVADAEDLATLKRNNEMLLQELTDVRAKYQALNARLMRETGR